MSPVADLVLFFLPAVLFLPVAYLLVRAIIWPEHDVEGREISRIVPGLMLATLLAMVLAWIVVGITHLP